MAWEARGGSRYYYSARKVGGRTVKFYFGRGAEGELAERLEAGPRRARAAAASALKAEQERLAPADRAAAATAAAVELLLEASMAAAGYRRRHGGPWRRRRDVDRGLDA